MKNLLANNSDNNKLERFARAEHREDRDDGEWGKSNVEEEMKEKRREKRQSKTKDPARRDMAICMHPRALLLCLHGMDKVTVDAQEKLTIFRTPDT